jgi:hypothetical protein
MRFTITSDSAGNSAVWGPEAHGSVSVNNGVFSVTLGETSSIPTSVFTNDTRYLKIEVANPPDSTNYEAMSPTTQIVSVGYAYKAADADVAQSVVDNAITSAKIANGTVVRRIIAGSNITISDTEGSGTGSVTINSSGL